MVSTKSLDYTANIKVVPTSILPKIFFSAMNNDKISKFQRFTGYFKVELDNFRDFQFTFVYIPVVLPYNTFSPLCQRSCRNVSVQHAKNNNVSKIIFSKLFSADSKINFHGDSLMYNRQNNIDTPSKYYRQCRPQAHEAQEISTKTFVRTFPCL